MPNKLDVTPQTVAAETLSALGDQLVIGNLIYRDKTPDFGKVNGFAVGDTVNIKQRPDYTVEEFTAGGNIVVQAIRESKRSLTIEKHFDTSVEIGARERALDFDGFTEQVINPAAMRIAEKVDAYLGTKILEAAGQYNSADLFGTAADVALASEQATRQRISKPGRFALCTLGLEAKLLGQTWFNQSQTRGQPGVTSLQEAMMGRVMGMDFYASINHPEGQHQAGSGASLLNFPADTTGRGSNELIGSMVLPVDGSTGTYNEGDRIYVAGAPTPLIVGTGGFSGVSGDIPLQDPITEVMFDNAAVSTAAAGLNYSEMGVVTEETGFAYAMPPLDRPEGVDSAVITSEGMSIRVVSAYDIQTKVQTMSLDMIVGATAWDPRVSMLLTQGS